jgi:hypothetical protein
MNLLCEKCNQITVLPLAHKPGALKCKWEYFDVVPQAKHCYVIKAVLKSGEVLDLASNETCAVTP